MKLTLAKKRIIIAIALLVLATSVFCAVILPSSDIAYAKVWNDKNTESLWYYKDGQGRLDVFGAKAIVDTWDKSRISEPIVIAVIDTGIDMQHEIFDGVLLKNANGNVLGYNVNGANADGSVDISDESEKHGTEIAGNIAMLIKEFGLEDYIKIYPIKANDSNGGFQFEGLTKALNWATDNIHADVINMSLGTKQGDYNNKKLSIPQTISAYEVAIEKARQSAVIVAAAGNQQQNETKNQAFYPASLSGVISVANIGENGELYSSSYYHSTTDICAPGEKIFTANGYVVKSLYKDDAKGTSQSASFVSFATALLKLRCKVQNADVQATTLSRMVCRMGYEKSVTKDNIVIPALNLKTLVSASLNVDLGYKDPTEMSLVHNGTLGSGDYSGMVYMRADAVKPVEFYVKISPSGDVDPTVEDSVEWIVQVLRSVDDATVVEEYSLGKGRGATFKASRGGDYVIKARLPLYKNVEEVSQRVHVEFAKYYVGEVRVTLADRANEDVNDAPSSATIFTNEVTSFALTGVRYLNPYTETKWYVNGEYVASGKVFDFKPKKPGTYYITARFGDNAPVDFQYKFTAEVKSFILRPLDLSMLIIGCSIALAAAITVAVILIKKKKQTSIAKVQDDGNNADR